MTTTEAPTSTPAPSASTLPLAERTLSTLALIAGVVSVALGQTFFIPLAAIVLGVLGYQREPAGRAFAVWGIVLGAVMLFGWMILALIGVLFFVPFIPFAFL